MIEDLRYHGIASRDALHRSLGELPIVARRRSEFRLSSLVLAIMSPFLVLKAQYVQKILFATIILDIPLQFGTTLFHRPADAELGALKGLSISATTLALAGLYTSWFIEALTNRNVNQHKSPHINRALTLYLVFVVLSLFIARDVGLSLFEVFLFLQLYLVYVYVANMVRTREDVLFVVSLLLIGGLLESLTIISLRFSNMESTVLGPAHIYVESDARTGLTRVGGTMSPNIAGAYLSVLLAFSASALFTNLGRGRKWLALAVLGLGQIAIILTFSRGAWIALMLAVSVLCLVMWRRGGLSLKAPIAIFAILLLLYVPFRDSISNRVFGDDHGAAESRIPLMNLAFRIIAENPILGVGSNNFSVAMDSYLTGEFRDGRTFLFVVHNKYLLVWAETGILGLAAFLAFLLSAVRMGWQCWKFQDHLLSPLALGLVAGIAGHMVHMTADHFRNRPTQQLLWFGAGLLVAMHRMCSSTPDSCSSIT
jgi:putative inorganic carbon (HCO3(-)) transporter